MSLSKRLLQVIVCTCVLSGARHANAATLTLAWDPIPDTPIGYLLYWGTDPGVYTEILNTGTQTTARVLGLRSATTYYFAVKAYNTSASVGEASTELSVTTPALAPNVTDLNGDNKFDLLWQHDTSGEVAVWYMSGAQSDVPESVASLGGAVGWTLAAAADLNADGKTDLIWQHDATRQVAVWHMTGAQGNVIQDWAWISQTALPGWRVVGARDFNSDAIIDLVWMHETSRQVAVWYLGGPDGSTLQSWAWLASRGPGPWTIVGVGDFNGDEAPDLVWQHDTTRQVAVWYMGGPGGATMIDWRWLTQYYMAGWTVVGSRDWNADGTADVVWLHEASREVAVWFMGGPQGTTLSGATWLTRGSVPGWRAVAR
jgi:hypothetical protein